MGSPVIITPDIPEQQSAVTITPDKPRGAIDSVKEFGQELWKKINPVSALYGARDLAAHPIDSLKADATARDEVYQKAEKAFKSGDYAGGSAHLLYSFIPMLGPQLSESGSQLQSGQYAKGAGSATGIGVSLAAPEILPSALAKMAPREAMDALSKRMYQSTLKPPPGSYSTSEVTKMVNTGLENKIPISEGGAARLDQLVGDLQNKVRDQIKSGNATGATIDPADVAARADQAKVAFAKQVNKGTDLSAIDASKQQFLDENPNPIPVEDAQAMKTGTYAKLRKSYGEQSGAAVEAQKALARGIKEELEAQFPEIKDLNAREGMLINLDGALERAVRRTNNRDLLSMGGKIASGAGGSIIGASHGSVGAGMGGAAALILHHALTDPVVQSKLAIALRSASKGSMTLDAAKLRVAAYSDALGNANQASGDTNGQQ